jgi:uncharacterized protein
MRALLLGLYVALVLLVGASGTLAQSADNKPPQSIETLKKRAAGGDAKAEYDLGQLYAVGRGVPQDYVQAAIWYRKAAEQGDADAQNNLGAAYHEGHGVARDYAQAVVWIRKSAEHGNARGQMSLGGLYLAGDGVPQDYAEAYFWLDIAASGKLEDSTMKDLRTDRDDAASNLTKTVLLQTQERARRWFEAHPPKAQ